MSESEDIIVSETYASEQHRKGTEGAKDFMHARK